MRILIYGINFSPEIIGTGKYTAEMANWLSSKGEEVRVITSYPYYPKWKLFDEYNRQGYTKEGSDNGLQVLRSPIYIPKNPRTLTRLLHLLSFSATSLPVLLRQQRWRPDIVLLVAPTMCCAPQTTFLSRLSGALSVLHIQDFEVDALFGLGMARAGLLRKTALWLERVLLRQFNIVSTISPGMLQRAREKGIPDINLRLLPNWSEVDRFCGVERSESLLHSLGVNKNQQVILYAGNLGEKQGLEVILECATDFSSDTNVRFLVVGEGPAKAKLMRSCHDRGISNVVFAPLQPYESLPALLASADCHLVIQKRGVADAVMPSKLTNILAAGGNAVITADKDTSLGRLCADFPGIATLVEPESAAALSAGIRSALSQAKPNQIALEYAQEYLSKDKILSRFFNELQVIVQSRTQARA